MKKILVLLIMLLTFMIQAQDWQTDFETAKSLAAEQDKPIILVFQGSDWCAPCIKLEKEIWSSEDFIAYSKEHYIMLKADFPRKRQNSLSAEQQEKNNALAEKYNKEGYFPLVVVLDKEGKVLGTTGYKKLTPSEYIELLNSFIQ